MFSKSLIFSVALCLGLANAHAIITPALGLSGAQPAVRADVQRPSAAAPCGTVAIAPNVDSSVPAIAASNGTVSLTITDFNGGVDGSRQLATAVLDPTATGASFPVVLDVLVNGDLAPTTVGSQPLVVQIPEGTVCTGGAAGNKCHASFITAGKFGNCVVIQQ